MPIAINELKQNFIIVDETTTVIETRQHIRAQGDNWAYIVVQLANGQYAVFLLAALIAALKEWQEGPLQTNALSSPLRAVPGFLAGLAGEAVEQASMTTREARVTARARPNGCLPIAAQGEIIGVLAETYRQGVTLDLRYLEHHSSGTPKGYGFVEQSTPRDIFSPDRVLSGSQSPEAAQPASRHINVELFDGQNDLIDPRITPLKLDDVYYLSFDVDVKLRAMSIAQEDTEFEYTFAPGQSMAKVTVRLESEAFEFDEGNEKILRVPRTGPSKNRAQFMLVPNQEGEAKITALFLKEDGSLIQVMELKFYVGELFSATTLGYDVNAAFSLPKRDLNLTILQVADGFQLVMTGPVGATCKLPLTIPQLAEMIDEARQALLNVVHMKHNGTYPYQQGDVNISSEARDTALKSLSGAGYDLFNGLFFGPAADAQTRRLGRTLREMAQREKMHIKIFSQHFLLPWGMLYVAERYDPYEVDPEQFLGLKHVIEHIPLQPEMQVTSEKINARQGLKVGLGVNENIDRQMNAPLVEQQLQDWEHYAHTAGVDLQVRKTGRDLVTALRDPQTPDQVLYFYCHAESHMLGERGGPGSSALHMTGDKVTLKDLQRAAPSSDKLPGNPLVFINACESAELSPLFYDGFVPYFMAKGARGVIGTACETPADFALDWATRFFKAFLQGKPLGEVFLDLRRTYFYEHNNILGLLYALYVDGDTRVEPALVVE